MIILGNVLLATAVLAFLLVSNLTFSRTLPGGDAVVGYAWSIIIGIVVFSISLLIATAIIGFKGGFDWVGASTGQRVTYVILGFLLILVGNGFFMANEFPQDLAPAVRKVVRITPAVLPVLLLTSAAILLNFKHTELPASVYKIPIYSSLIISFLGFVMILFGQAKRSADMLKADEEFKDKIHQDHLNQIDTTDVMKDGVFLYVFTDANQSTDVQEAALAKLKTRPDWQEELVRRLQSDWAKEAFTFLASNDVDDKAMFVEPIRQGILIQAKLIREDIRRCRGAYDLHGDSFRWEVERMLRTVDKFAGMGVDYRPAVLEVRNALEEPTDFEKPKLAAKSLLDNWLKSSKK
jgi:hypothetical protein